MSGEKSPTAEARGRVPERSSQDRKALGVLGGSCAEFMLIRCSVSPARMEALAFPFLPYPPRIYKEIMSHIDKEKQRLVARIKRIRGQVDSIERSLTEEDDC